MTNEAQLPKPDFFNKGSCFCEAVDFSIWHPVDSPDVYQNSIAGRSKRIDFIFRVFRDDP